MNERVFFVVLPLCASVSVLAAGCGDLYSDPADPSSPETTLPSFPPSAVDAAATVPRDFIPGCTTKAPVASSSCGPIGSVCEYGNSPDMQCNVTFACVDDLVTGAAWVSRPSVLCPSYECPKSSTVASLEGTPCGLPTSEGGAPADVDELICPMTDGVCACTTGPDAAHAHARRWACTRPSSGCPTARPLVGSSCTTPRTCDYGGCAFKRGLTMVCSSSLVWTGGSATCN